MGWRVYPDLKGTVGSGKAKKLVKNWEIQVNMELLMLEDGIAHLLSKQEATGLVMLEQFGK